MSIETLGQVGGYLWKLRREALYPGFPFFAVPIIVVWMIVIQFDGFLALNPGGQVSSLHFASSLKSSGLVEEADSTLIVVPKTARSFFLPDPEAEIEEISLSVAETDMNKNTNKIVREPGGVRVEKDWFGVRYPVILYLAGARQELVALPGTEEGILPALELATPDVAWVTLGAVLGAIFSIGLAVGFIKDSTSLPS